MDLFTLVVVAVLMTFASSSILLVVHLTRKTYPGFGLWVGAMTLVLVGTLLYVTMLRVQPWLAILSGNFLLVAGFVFFYRGLLVFRGRSASYAFETALALLFFGGFIYWGFTNPNINLRIATYSLCIGAVSIAALRVVLTERPPYFGSSDIVLAVWLTIIAGYTTVRAAYAVLFLPQIESLLTETGFQSLYIAFQIISALVITLSVINLNSQRLEYDLRAVQKVLEEDIEERRRIEGALLRSQQQYRSLTENMEDNAWIYDMDEQRFVYVSSSVRKLRGYSADEAMGLGIDSMALPENRERLQQMLHERFEDFLSEKITSQNFFVDEIEQPRKNGSSVWTEISSHFVRSTETGHVELHGITRDLTRRREIDEALRASEAKFRLAFDSANSGMFLSDLEGRIEQANPRAGQILGYPVSQLIGSRDQDFALPGDAWLTDTNRKRMTDGLVDHCTYEQRFTHREGQVVHCLVSSALVRGSDGTPKSFITQLQDITQRRLAEKALHAAFKKSDTQAARVGALNEMVDALMRCERSDHAIAPVDAGLRKIFFPFNAEFVEVDPNGRLPQALPESLDVPVQLHARTLGLIRIHAGPAALREEDEDMANFAETVADSISLAMSNLQLREDMRRQVARDDVTGLYNRRYLDEILSHELDRCARLRQPLSVALIDLGGYRELTARLGSEAGDAALRGAAALVAQSSRASDKACRYEESTFAIVMPGAEAANVLVRLRSLCAGLEELRTEWNDVVLPPLAACIGIAQVLSRGDKPAMLLQRADAVLRNAMQQGRNTVLIHEL